MFTNLMTPVDLAHVDQMEKAVTRAAKDLEADLIVMASPPGLAEHLFASNAGYLAPHMDTSVMVIR